jgi:site-specific DNA recombinase
MGNDGDKIQTPIRCAIYTRKSTNEGLDQDFTSLDAQRESCENYVASQKNEGWILLPDKYDDGGFTGANMERPGLRQLLNGVKDKKIDCVVVYKVDRLSRSLIDFTRLLELFEKQQVTFVSVTQAFNTNNSMGRLTLNILLSFAQFEREIISERTKDKMGMARKRGKWTGGTIPLGYDLDRANHKLVVNPQEADQVREIFSLYLKAKSIRRVTETLNNQGRKTKEYLTADNKTMGGRKIDLGYIQRILKSMLYLGKIKYQGEVYPGLHDAIVEEDLFNRVQEILSENLVMAVNPQSKSKKGLLVNLLHCKNCNRAMIYTHTQKTKTKRYAYYVCMGAQKNGYHTCPTRSVNAEFMEDEVMKALRKIATSPEELNKYAAIVAPEELRKALLVNSPVWDELFPEEKRRVLRTILQSVDYDGERKVLGINISPKGIKSMNLEMELLDSKK